MLATLSAMRFLAMKPKVFLQPVTGREGYVEADMLPTTHLYRDRHAAYLYTYLQLVLTNKNGDGAF